MFNIYHFSGRCRRPVCIGRYPTIDEAASKLNETTAFYRKLPGCEVRDICWHNGVPTWSSIRRNFRGGLGWGQHTDTYMIRESKPKL